MVSTLFNQLGKLDLHTVSETSTIWSDYVVYIQNNSFGKIQVVLTNSTITVLQIHIHVQDNKSSKALKDGK